MNAGWLWPAWWLLAARQLSEIVDAPQTRAQPQAAALSFEAASIKPTKATGEGASFDRHPGGLWITNATLQDCIREAYGVTDSRIPGQNRIKPDRYDIVAKMPPGVPQDQRPAMLQALLAERFKPAVHRATRELPVYSLGSRKERTEDSSRRRVQGRLTSRRAGYLSAVAVSMSNLAAFLSGARTQLGHPVLDQTGLNGVFTFTLEWTPDDKGSAKGSADAMGPSVVRTARATGFEIGDGQSPG